MIDEEGFTGQAKPGADGKALKCIKSH